MARKSKELLWQENLNSISQCSTDIFEELEPSEKLLYEIEKAEKGDILTLETLTSELFSKVLIKNKKSDSLKYLCILGIKGKSILCANTLADYIIKIADGYEQIETLKNFTNENAKDNNELSQKISVLTALNYAFKSENQQNNINFSSVENENFSNPLKLYVLSYAQRKGIDVYKNIQNIAKEEEIPEIAYLPSFLNNTKITTHNHSGKKSNVINKLKEYLYSLDNENWRNFWIVCLYEYCDLFNNRDFTDIDKDILKVVKDRYYCSKASLHTLAWMKYIKENNFFSNEEEFKNLLNDIEKEKEKCKFNGILTDIGNDGIYENILRDAVYTNSFEERKKFEKLNSLGFIINYTKNRYSLNCELNNHSKRGKKHFWETKISFLTENSSSAPKFDTVNIDKVNNIVTRYGASLEYNRNISQVLGLGEIEFNFIKHPLSIDFILDMGYISAVKCSQINFKIKNSEYKQGAFTMTVQIFAY